MSKPRLTAKQKAFLKEIFVSYTVGWRWDSETIHQVPPADTLIWDNDVVFEFEHQELRTATSLERKGFLTIGVSSSGWCGASIPTEIVFDEIRGLLKL